MAPVFLFVFLMEEGLCKLWFRTGSGSVDDGGVYIGIALGDSGGGSFT